MMRSFYKLFAFFFAALVFGTTLFAEDAAGVDQAVPSSRVECYLKFYPKIINAQSSAIVGMANLFKLETGLLDKIFNPEQFYRGPVVFYIAEKKAELLDERVNTSKSVIPHLEASATASKDLEECLKYNKQ